MEPLTVLLLLVLAHFACDFCLQSDSVAIGKNRFLDTHYRTVWWVWWMAGHCAVHALAVYGITGSTGLSVFQFIAHFAIDFSKCLAGSCLPEAGRDSGVDLYRTKCLRRFADADQVAHLATMSLIWIIWLHARG